MIYIKTIEEFLLLEAFSLPIIKKIKAKFLLERPELTDVILDYYINSFDKYKEKFKQKDIFKYKFNELEKLIDSIPKKVEKSNMNNIDPTDILVDNDNLLILKGDTKEKCIKYGRGYTWCISRNDSSNMFNTYRYRHDEINFYFIFDKSLKDTTDSKRALVLLVDKNNTYYLADATNSGDFTGSKKYKWSQIVKIKPLLKEYNTVFKPLPLTERERDISKLIKYNTSLDLFEKFKEYEIVESYIAFGHALSDKQFNNLPEVLQMKYINLGGVIYPNMIFSSKIQKRHEHLTSFQYWFDSNYTVEEQNSMDIVDCSYNHAKLTNLNGLENYHNIKMLTTKYNDFKDVLIIPNNITILGDMCFESCNLLKEVVLHDKITSISKNCFMNCMNILKIEIPKNVDHININAFYGCEKLTSIIIPHKVKKLNKRTFYGCEKLKTVELNNVEEIEDNVFSNCKSLEYIDLSKVKKIGYAFSNTNLKEVIISKNTIVQSSTMDCTIEELFNPTTKIIYV